MLAEKPKWQVQEKSVVVSFPVKETGKDVKANVLFYRPSDSGKDVTINVTADSSGQAIVTSNKLQHGVYRMQIDWEAGSTTYYTEGIVNLN
jgi:nitrogen fixation protein FixH